MFDYPFDAPESSHILLPTMTHSTESQHSISLFDVFDWKAHDRLNDAETSLININTNEWNNLQWDDEFIDNRTLQQSWNATQEYGTDQQSPLDTPKIPTSIDFSSLMTFFQLKQNSDKIRRALVIHSFSICYFPVYISIKGHYEFSSYYLFGSSSSHSFNHQSSYLRC
jgi:hypothetical protein